MIHEPRPGRYRLHRPGSAEAEAILAELGLTRADLARALATLERNEGIRVRSIVGINLDGVFGSTRQRCLPTSPTPARSRSSRCSGSRSWSC